MITKIEASEIPLLESTIFPDPLVQFKHWFEMAQVAGLSEPNAMTLATSTREGKPSARMVLLKSYDENGFVFFTNYTSRKGKELSRNPSAALVFWWDLLERQVRIEGKVQKITIQESDVYFASRPRGSQLATCVSRQSEVIRSRDLLEKEWQELSEKYRSGKIPKPPEWGGFRLIPVVFEFWQGRAHRLHDRLRFTLQKNRNWKIERLSP